MAKEIRTCEDFVVSELLKVREENERLRAEVGAVHKTWSELDETLGKVVKFLRETYQPALDSAGDYRFTIKDNYSVYKKYDAKNFALICELLGTTEDEFKEEK